MVLHRHCGVAVFEHIMRSGITTMSGLDVNVISVKSCIYSTFPCLLVHAACTRCCRASSSLLPMMSVGDNRRKRTGRMSYLSAPHFLSLPLSHVSLGSEL